MDDNFHGASLPEHHRPRAACARPLPRMPSIRFLPFAPIWSKYRLTVYH